MPLGGDDGQGDKPLAFQTIERMARYLAAHGKFVESAQMWLRLEPMLKELGWWVPDSLVQAVR